MGLQFPVDIVIGALVIPIHLLADLLAFAVGIQYYLHHRKGQRDSVGDDERTWILVGAALGAALGAHLIGALENPALFLHPPSLLYYFSSKTLVGGLLGGLIGVESTKRLLGVKTRTGDAFVFPLLLGMIIGRIGCFLTGVSDNTVGIASSFFLAFDQGDGIARHPTSLYEIVFLLLLWVALQLASKRWKLKQGALFQLFMLSYLSFRLLIDFIKPGVPLVLGMTVIQLACLLGVVYYVWTLHREGLRQRNAKTVHIL